MTAMHFKGPAHEGRDPLVFPDLESLDKPPLGKRDHARSGHDEMVENLHIHQSLGLLEALREKLIGAARFRYSRRMVMREHDCGGIAR